MIFLFSISLLIAGTAHAGAPPSAPAWDSPYSLKISASEARESVIGLLEASPFSAEESSIWAARLLRSYRSSSTSEPASFPLRDAPYVHTLIHTKLPELYESVYDSTYREQLGKIENDPNYPPLELLFDTFMDGIIHGTLPASMKKAAGQIGKTLARKVRRGKSARCKLDEGPGLHAPGTLKLLFVKSSAILHLPLPTACQSRHAVFDAAKAQLIAARKDPEIKKMIRAEFEKRFPEEFRVGFVAEINTKVAALPELVSAKFNAPVDRFWDGKTGVIELETAGHLSSRDFTLGLRADLETAIRFAGSADAKLRALAAPLFYAAANRLLVYTGGSQALWDGKEYVSEPGDAFDPARPKKAPVFRSSTYGGWSAGSVGGKVGFQAWDWQSYDPLANSAAFRIFPSEWISGELGIPSVAQGAPYSGASENLAQLGGLIEGLGQFLAATRKDGPLSKYFVDTAEMAKVLDPKSPAIFPREGRQLAVGMLAGVLKNLIAPGMGHLEETSPGGGSIGLVFHDTVSVNGRVNEQPSVAGVSQLIVAAAHLKPALSGDVEIPSELQAQLSKIDSAVEIGALYLGSKAQAGDGGFFEQVGVPLVSGRKTRTHVEALRALTQAYEGSSIPVLRLSIRDAWLFLDRLWGSAATPPSEEGAPGSRLLPGEVYSLLRLWNETQRTVRPHLKGEIPWEIWDARFQTLSEKLREQLKGAGPEPL